LPQVDLELGRRGRRVWEGWRAKDGRVTVEMAAARSEDVRRRRGGEARRGGSEGGEAARWRG